MTSFSMLNTEPGRWAKIVRAVDSGQYPHIMVEDGKLVTVPQAGDAGKIYSFLAHVFKEGDNEWFKTFDDSLEAGKRAAVDNDQPEGSKKKKISLTKQREIARQMKKDQELGTTRVELVKDAYTAEEWKKITKAVGTVGPVGMSLEGDKVVATDHFFTAAEQKLNQFVDFALGFDRAPLPGDLIDLAPSHERRW